MRLKAICRRCLREKSLGISVSCIGGLITSIMKRERTAKCHQVPGSMYAIARLVGSVFACIATTLHRNADLEGEIGTIRDNRNNRKKPGKVGKCLHI